MIYGILVGGLGNQMHIIATAYALARRLGTVAAFPRETNENLIGITPRKSYAKTILKYIDRQPHPAYPIYREPRFNFNPLPPRNNLILSGYFQTEKYFKDYKADITSLFMRYFYETKSIKEFVNGFFEKERTTIAVHIRRGDYLKFPKIHPIQTADYYLEGINYIVGKHNIAKPVIVMFSDDMDWCMSDKNSLYKTLEALDVEVWFCNVSSDIVEFYTMAHCDHHVIANSSFSWWAAWLCPNKNTIVAPKKWFGKGFRNDWSDVYCDGWKVL